MIWILDPLDAVPTCTYLLPGRRTAAAIIVDVQLQLEPSIQICQGARWDSEPSGVNSHLFWMWARGLWPEGTRDRLHP